jgi:hypothetical protein
MPVTRVFKVKIVAVAALVLFFGSGIVVGMAWDQTASTSTPEETRDQTRSERRRGRRTLIVEGVGLTAFQKASVDSLVSFHRKRMSELNEEFRPRYRAVVADLREEIKGVLTDDQREMYDTLLAETDARRRARRTRSSRQ